MTQLKSHYSEADLLETWYTKPGASLPIMMHLADCADCAARFERLERKMHDLSACAHADDKPESFWSRQRASVMRKVAMQTAKPAPLTRTLRVAAAAALAFVLGGVVTYKSIEQNPAPVVVTHTASATTTSLTTSSTTASTSTSVPTDPWQTDELKDFQSLVAWESWDDSTATTQKSGDTSL
ncbi:MAG TPA: hypothetical protein VFN10_03980 [Thermoanaerobaculia bacterium]|nr:hypothetical protein [Thermoanaerobaculia bacterium]